MRKNRIRIRKKRKQDIEDLVFSNDEEMFGFDEEAEWENVNGVTLNSFADLRLDDDSNFASASSSGQNMSLDHIDNDVNNFFRQFENEIGVEKVEMLVKELSKQGMSGKHLKHITTADLTKYEIPVDIANIISERAKLKSPKTTEYSPVSVYRVEELSPRQHSELGNPLESQRSVALVSVSHLMPLLNNKEEKEALYDLAEFFSQFDELEPLLMKRLMVIFARQGLTRKHLHHLKPHDLMKYNVNERLANKISGIARQTEGIIYHSPPSGIAVNIVNSLSNVNEMSASEADDEDLDSGFVITNEFQALQSESDVWFSETKSDATNELSSFSNKSTPTSKNIIAKNQSTIAQNKNEQPNENNRSSKSNHYKIKKAAQEKGVEENHKEEEVNHKKHKANHKHRRSKKKSKRKN